MPSTSPADLAVCESCGHAILWTVTAAAARLAVDPGESDDGNTAVYTDQTGRYRSRRLTTERPTLEHAEWRAMPHVATCPLPPARRRRPSSGPPRTQRRSWIRPGWQA